MILTTCAACAAPLAHDAPRCVRCWTRYCNATCQHDHWRRGHKQMCKKIHRGGNAEQYHADKKYKEAVAVAVEACADDTKGQTCYICTQALHWKTKEGLVRGCSCRGTAGFAHVSCLAEQAKILVAEAEENNLDLKDFNSRWHRWDACSLCGQEYHGVVACALGWACWRTYVGRPEADQTKSTGHIKGVRISAMTMLEVGMSKVHLHEERLGILEAQLAVVRRTPIAPAGYLNIMNNLAVCYSHLGRDEQALALRREVYAKAVPIYGSSDPQHLLIDALNLSSSLVSVGNFSEAISFLRQRLVEANDTIGSEHDTTLCLCMSLGQALVCDKQASPDQLREAVALLERTHRISQRVLGGQHPNTKKIQDSLSLARLALSLGRGLGPLARQR